MFVSCFRRCVQHHKRFHRRRLLDDVVTVVGLPIILASSGGFLDVLCVCLDHVGSVALQQAPRVVKDGFLVELNWFVVAFWLEFGGICVDGGLLLFYVFVAVFQHVLETLRLLRLLNGTWGIILGGRSRYLRGHGVTVLAEADFVFVVDDLLGKDAALVGRWRSRFDEEFLFGFPVLWQCSKFGQLFVANNLELVGLTQLDVGLWFRNYWSTSGMVNVGASVNLRK